MARSVKILSKFTVPGSGFTSAGVAKQNKQVVVARMDVTSYTTGGESLTPADLGLETIDFVSAEVSQAGASLINPAAGLFFSAQHLRSTSLLLIHEETDAGTQLDSTDLATVHILAVGDSAFVADLT